LTLSKLDPSLHKLIAALHPPAPLSLSGKIVFYVLSPLPEDIAIALFLSDDINELFAVKEASWKNKVEKRMKKGSWPSGVGYVEETAYDRLEGSKVGMELQATRG
jgi:hypothetical protein